MEGLPKLAEGLPKLVEGLPKLVGGLLSPVVGLANPGDVLQANAVVEVPNPGGGLFSALE